MIAHILLLFNKMLTTTRVAVSSCMDIGGKLCVEDLLVLWGVIWKKLWHMDYVCRQLLAYKQSISAAYYKHGWDVIVPMVLVQGGLLTILILIYKGKLDEICSLEWPLGDKILGIPVVQKLIKVSALSINTSKVVILLLASAIILWLFPRGVRWILLGLWGKMIRSLYINMHAGVQVIFQAPWLHIKITRYWQEQELLQFITTTISSYKNYTAQPQLQVNIDKLLTQLNSTSCTNYDELQLVQHISMYLHTYYPKPIPPTWGEIVTEYLFIQHPALAITLITVSMLTVICIVHNRPRPDMEIYHWRRPWDWEWEWPWDTVDWYDVPDGKNLSDYTYEQLEQFRVARPSRAHLVSGKVPGEGIRRARLWEYWKWDMFKYHNLRTYRWYQYYEQLEDWWERRRNRGA